MPKGEFKCALCKRTISADSWSNDKYKCPTHKDLCSKCVTHRGIIGGHYCCDKCDKPTVVYSYHQEYGKWMKYTRY